MVLYLPGTLFECSDNDWLDQKLYCKWFKYFLTSIPPARPVEDVHSLHVSLDVIKMARDNNVHLLCLPAHTTHLLQPLDVGVFKSLKSNFSRACLRYLSTHPGQVITTDILASLLCQAWPQSITPVNAMSGFRKCGIYPLNPGEISDRQLAPSKVFTRSASDSNLLKSSFTVEQEKLYQKRFEEGYDIDDSDYSEWLRFNHPDHNSDDQCLNAHVHLLLVLVNLIAHFPINPMPVKVQEIRYHQVCLHMLLILFVQVL